MALRRFSRIPSVPQDSERVVICRGWRAIFSAVDPDYPGRLS
jgi:hypothetical protein